MLNRSRYHALALLQFDMSNAIQSTQTSEGSDENDTVWDEDSGWNQINSSINVHPDRVNRIEYIAHTDWVQMLDCEILNIAMNVRSARE